MRYRRSLEPELQERFDALRSGDLVTFVSPKDGLEKKGIIAGFRTTGEQPYIILRSEAILPLASILSRIRRGESEQLVFTSLENVST
jgi:hypothetical protein